ncbi:MAG TPA: DUF4397 domain-containing protein [Candidatus Limnocylindrales bacterium]|nr:DUF4397 domain-containing protein [Candidatus Limnocylindrales bacterium]
MNRTRSRIAAILAASAMLLAVTGGATAADEAMVRVLHASPDAPAVDVYVDGAKVGAPLAGLEFGDISTYVALPAGTYDLKVCAAADATICPIVADDVALTAGTKYTIAATNDLASIEAQIITDAPAPVAGKTQVRVVHFSADTPAVDVLTQDGAATVVNALAYPNATGYLTLDPGAYDLKVCADADNTVCPLDPGSLDLAGGTSYSVFAIGSLTAETPTLTAAVAVDAVAAPATDTVGSSGTWGPVALVLAGLTLLVGAVRLTVRRVAA